MSKLKVFFLIIFGLIITFFVFNNLLMMMYPIKYYSYIEKYSAMYDLDKYLVMSVIKVESNFNEKATSVKDARGLMQITPSTGNWIAEQMNLVEFSPDKLYDPEQNIFMGCWYLDNLRKEFDDNYMLILSAYNAGRGNVNKWLQNPEFSKDGKNLDYIPFKETELYIKKINLNYNIYKALYGDKLIDNSKNYNYN
ncbi:MAG TPA: lytic transglycosylase domain-containing protein [Candidatus Dwaynia gallinarum]|nr:lytic transglycosylase domain-containing protein [Candidatus Dwaynia gallinarum]